MVARRRSPAAPSWLGALALFLCVGGSLHELREARRGRVLNNGEILHVIQQRLEAPPGPGSSEEEGWWEPEPMLLLVAVAVCLPTHGGPPD